MLAADRFTAAARCRELTVNTMIKVRAFFERQTQHRPSETAYEALEDIASTLAAMATGTAENKVYLSSLDPGMGKTTTISSFIDKFLEGETHAEVGVIICLARIDEIRTLVNDMAIPKEIFAVLTSDEAVNQLGSSSHSKARVLFTTQQMIESRAKGKTFEETECFYFKGKPRDVRIWDESWLPGKGITLNRDDVMRIVLDLRSAYPELAETLENLSISLKEREDGERVCLPDFETEHDVDLNDALSVIDAASSEMERRSRDITREHMAGLWFLSGKTVTIRNDGPFGNTALDYKDTLPEDLAPLLVTDASGRVRETYFEMERTRENISRLRSAPKDYGPLTVHVWKTAGGKGAFNRKTGDPKKLIDGIASTINTKMDEEWLVVSHKPSKWVVDIEQVVSDLIEGDKGRVHFINWGRHMATNNYANVPNVILAGTLFYRQSHYEALGRLASGRPSGSGKYPKTDRQRMQAGESKHGILQAACRCSVRQSDGDKCRPADLYVIGSVRSGVPELMADVFPNCAVVSWKPVRTALRGKVKQAIDYLDKAFSNPTTKIIKFKQVKEAIGVSCNKNFRNDIRRHEGFVEALADRSLYEWGSGKYFTGFKRIDGEDFGFEVEAS